MTIRNKSSKRELARSCKVCRSAWSKAKGLMFTNESTVKNNALVFEFKKPMLQSLHMFFVFYPIDVLFLDDNSCVVEMKQGFRPFTIYNSKMRAKYVIELPQGSIKNSRTSLGDEIIW